MKNRDTVTGWFGTGVITDMPDHDDVIRVRLDRDGKKVYVWSLKSDAKVVEEVNDDAL